MSDLDDIYSAVCELSYAADHALDTARGADQYDRAREMQRRARCAKAAYSRVAEIYKIGLSAKAEREYSYDAMVKNGEDKEP